MATTPATGKDVSVQLTIDAVVVDECAATEFTETANYDDVVTRPLGKSESDIDRNFESWSGTITFVERDARLQALVDAYNAALRNRVPVQLDITRTINYRDGTQNTKVYPDVRIDYENRMVRGETNTVTINWQTGKDRI